MTVTSLSLHNLYPSALSSLDSPPFQTLLKTLRHLQLFMTLDGTWRTNQSIDHWCNFWGTLCPRIFLDPTQHTLTELTLHSNTYVGASSGLSLRELHFPHLCALSLRNLVFDRSVGAEYFVLRHTSTLARLELLFCKLPIDRHQQQPPILILGSSTILPGDDESGSGLDCWYGIWDRFAAELTALVVLHVEERRRIPSIRLECPYVKPGPSVSYCEIDVPELRKVTDAEALRRFQTTVAARSEEMRRKS